MMNKSLVLGILALSACTNTGDLTPAAKTQLAAICAKDAAMQPLVASDVAALAAMGVVIPAPQAQMAAGGAATAVAIDNSLVHPTVVAACAKLTAPAPAAAPVAAK